MKLGWLVAWQADLLILILGLVLNLVSEPPETPIV